MSSLKFRVWGLYGDEYTYIDKENRAEAESFWDRGCIAILDEKHIIECGTDEDGEGEGCEYWHVEAVKAIEQYTGLKDKNDKEIYEGDIIHRGRLPKVNVFRNSVIRFDKESVGFIATSTRNGARTIFDGYTCDEIEVIGNIHENPELLEKE